MPNDTLLFPLNVLLKFPLLTNQLLLLSQNDINDTSFSCNIRMKDEFFKKYLLKVIVFCELFTFDILKAD